MFILPLFPGPVKLNLRASGWEADSGRGFVRIWPAWALEISCFDGQHIEKNKY
jgi:hypothetical protein